MNQKAYWAGGKSFFSFIIGLAFLLIGLAPILPTLNIQALSFIPLSFITAEAIKIALLVGGLILLVESFIVGHPKSPTRLFTILAGLLMAVIGAIPLLVMDYQLVSVPFVATLTIPPLVLEGVLAFFGLYLIIDAFMMYPRYHRYPY